MDKRLVLLENDVEITKSRHRFVYHFANEFDGEVVHLCNIRNISSEEIFKEFSNCTDIAFQSSLIGGSEYQVEGYLRMLMTIKTPINLTIRYMGGDIKEWLVELFTPDELVKLSHHNFFELNRMYSDDDVQNYKFDFTKETAKYLAAKKIKADYTDTAIDRPTGRKIKVIGCNANGPGFKNLPIGEIVDELDMSAIDLNKSRGVWIMGNGEPIKLINDCGFEEFEIVAEDPTSEELVDNIFSTFSINSEKFTVEEYREIISLVDTRDNANKMSIANTICEIADLPKRGNRHKIYKLLWK